MFTTKHRPGIYLTPQVSYKYREAERVKRQLEFMTYMNEKDTSNNITGSWNYLLWKSLDSNPFLLEQLLDSATKPVMVKIIDRWFGSNRYTPPIPANILTLGSQFKGNAHSGLIWHPEYTEAQIRFMERIKAYDTHPMLEQISWGESSVSHDNSALDYTNNLIKLWHGCKANFPHTSIAMNLNFLGDGNRHIQRIVDEMEKYGGGACCNPDSVPGHKEGYKGKYPLWLYNPKRPYYIDAYKVFAATDSIAMTPHMETLAIRSSQVKESLDMCIDYFGATHVKLQTSFDSKYESAISQKTYFTQYLLPAINGITDSQKESMNKIPSRLNYKPEGYKNSPVEIKTEEPEVILVELPKTEKTITSKNKTIIEFIDTVLQAIRKWLVSLV